MISPRMKKAILEQLRLDDFDLRDETTADQVPGWDSLSHVQILTAVENEFDIRFSGLEVLRLKNVGELQALVDKKLR
jgi:acyl carrier protein